MDIIEANECLRAWLSEEAKGNSFDEDDEDNADSFVNSQPLD